VIKVSGKLGMRVVNYALSHREGGAEAHPHWFKEAWDLYDRGLATKEELAQQTHNSMMYLHYMRMGEGDASA